MHGQRTGYELHRRMHQDVRGMHYKMPGRDDDAVLELRRSLYSPTVGYIRANYELGRAAAYARVASAWERGNPIVQARRAMAASRARQLAERL